MYQGSHSTYDNQTKGNLGKLHIGSTQKGTPWSLSTGRKVSTGLFVFMKYEIMFGLQFKDKLFHSSLILVNQYIFLEMKAWIFLKP